MPTPGQAELEYLANDHRDQGNFENQQQSDFELNNIG